jgi:hypothetical protein
VISRTHLTFALGFLLLAGTATASVVAIGPGGFPAGSTVLTLTGLADGTEVNGLTVSGVLFNYSLGDGFVIIDGGPGITNNVDPPNIVSVGDDTGIVTVTLPSLVNTFGYGYAILNTDPVAGATTINLFNGATPVGSLSYDGVPDPAFSGGFAGISSTLLFDRVELTFNSAAAPAFAFDNVTFGVAADVPEPSTLLLIATGIGLLLCRRSGAPAKA